MIGLRGVFGDGRARSDEQDFVARYARGKPWDGYADREVLDRFREVTTSLPPAAFELAAREAVARFSPQDRQLFGQYLQQQVHQQGRQIADLEGAAADDRFRDAAILGRALARIHYGQKGGIEQVLGTQDGWFDSLLAKGTLAGIAAALEPPSALGRAVG